MAGPPKGGEFGLIARHFAPLSRAEPGAFGLENDGAALHLPPGAALVATKDLMVEGVHYPVDETPSVIARRLLRTNLSDLAAMGAKALYYMLGLALPGDVSDSWLADFANGLTEDQTAFSVVLAGGDTVASGGPAVLSLTAFGRVPENQALVRSGARAGDDVYVSGTIGDGALGLRALRGGLNALGPEDRAFLAGRFRLPVPRLALGEALRGTASCAIDVSDGLIADLGHLCAMSGAAAQMRADAVPLSGAARRAVEIAGVGLAELLTGGDDYELLFCAPPARRAAVEHIASALDLPLTRIGAIAGGAGVTVIGANDRPLPLERTGYRHY